MARVALLLALILAALAPAASASTSIHWVTMDSPRSPWGQYNREIVVKGDDGVDHDVVVQPSYQDSRQPYPHVVEVYDYNDTLVNGSSPGITVQGTCRIYSSHHAGCYSDGLANYPEIAVSTGDGADKVTFNNFSNPMIFSTSTGAGNDNVSVDGAYACIAWLGPGDDRAHLGDSLSDSVSLCPATGWEIDGGDGNDVIDAVNHTQDRVDCGNGLDVFIGTPVFDTTVGCEPLP
jgi:hypothetical protein